MIRCIAYVEEDNRMCGEPAYIFDLDRHGWVCAEHHNDEPSETLEEATITLKIKTQAALIEYELAVRRALGSPKSKSFFEGVAARLDYLEKWNEQLRNEKDAIANDPAAESEETA